MKKYFLVLSLLAFVLVPFFASAASVEDLQLQIQKLLAQIKLLQEQIAQQTATSVWCHNFNTNLRFGDTGSEVKALYEAFVQEGDLIRSTENPDAPFEFDEAIASAVVGFQQKYASEILAPFGLKFGTGFVGKGTRAKLNALYGCGVLQPPAPIPSPIPPPAPPISISAPVITSISPSLGYPGIDRATMEIVGQNFRGAGAQSGCGLSHVSAERGFQFVSCKEISDTHIEAQFTIADNAELGARLISISTPAGGGSNKINFTIVKPDSTSITVLSPNGGEVWQKGSTQLIKWTTGNEKTSTVNIVLLNGTLSNLQTTRIIVSQTLNDGVFEWTVPQDLQEKTDYFIDVIFGMGVSDTSDAPFSITGVSVVAAPEMVYPVNGQVLNYGIPYGYMFKVKPVVGASGYLFGFFQNGEMIYENWRDDKTLSSNGEFAVWPDNPFYSKFQEGNLEVWIRTLTNNQWSDARIITITLVRPHPTITVLSPQENETIGFAQHYTFKWNVANPPLDPEGLFTIDGILEPEHFELFKHALKENTGSKTLTLFNVPNLQIQAGEHTLQVCLRKQGTVSYEYCGKRKFIVSSSTPITLESERDARRQLDIRTIATAQELYYNDHLLYVAGNTMPAAIGTYLATVPRDPGIGTPVYQWEDNSANTGDYCVFALLEQGKATNVIPAFLGGMSGVTKKVDIDTNDNNAVDATEVTLAACE